MSPNFITIEESGPVASSKFDIVPSGLRDELQAAFEKAASKYTKAALEAPAAALGTQYHLKKAVVYFIPKQEPEIVTIQTGFAFAATANIALVKHMIDEDIVDFATLPSQRCEPSLTGEANPQFLDEHAVTRGELSWGHDIFECLSLCFLTEGEDNELKREAYFVQRVYGGGEHSSTMRGFMDASVQREPAQKTGFKFSMKLARGGNNEHEDEDEDRLHKMMETGPSQSQNTHMEPSFAEFKAAFWAQHGGEPNTKERSTKRY